MENTKVKFHYYSTKANFDRAIAEPQNNELKGVVSFVADVKKLYLGKEEYCLGDTTQIQDVIKNSEDVKKLWDAINSVKNLADKNKKDIAALQNKVNSLDLSLYKVVTKLPNESDPDKPNPYKIYLVKDSNNVAGNEYDEWVYVNGKWEKIGSFRSTVDLTPYQKIADADTKYATKTQLTNTKNTLDQKDQAQDAKIKALEDNKLDKTTASTTYSTKNELNKVKTDQAAKDKDQDSKISANTGEIATAKGAIDSIKSDISKLQGGVSTATLVWEGDGIA